MRTCEYRECGTPLVPRAQEPPSDFENRKYCKRPHYLAELGARRADFLEQTKDCANPECIGEGKLTPRVSDWEHRSSWDTRTHCSRDCKAAHDNAELQKERKTCPQCGTVFGPTPGEKRVRWTGHTYCSPTCSARAGAATQAARAKAKHGEEGDVKECALPGCTERITRHSYESMTTFAGRRCCTRQHTFNLRNKAKIDAVSPKTCERPGCDEKMTYMGDYSKKETVAYLKVKYCSDECRNAMRSMNHRGGTETGTVHNEKPARPRDKNRGKRLEPVPVFPGPVPVEVWRPEGFPKTPVIPHHIREWNELNRPSVPVAA